MTSRAVVALGIGQCVNWGVLYYAFAVLVVPIQSDLGVATWVVTGAFSLALLMSAALAPAVGRWSDGGRGPRVMEAGTAAAVALLALWTIVPTLPTLYVVWAGLGFCMAATLYEPAFAIVGRAHVDPAVRLRALAVVTVFGGLASTLFLPATAFLVAALAWRGAVLVLAIALTLSAVMTRLAVFSDLRAAPTLPAARAVSRRSSGNLRVPPRFGFVLMVFSVTSFASAAFIANLVPALTARDVSPTSAAMLGGLLGVMQLPGRVLLMNGVLGASPARLIVESLMLQGSGLACLALASSLSAIAAGVMVFAIGAGLATLARPHFVQTMFDIDSAGYLNGQVARSQQLARAAGPIMVASLAAVVGYAAAFLLLSAAFGALALLSRSVLDDQPGPGASG